MACSCDQVYANYIVLYRRVYEDGPAASTKREWEVRLREETSTRAYKKFKSIVVMDPFDLAAIEYTASSKGTEVKRGSESFLIRRV